MARVPTAQALSARPPRPLPARQSVWAAAALLAAGAGALIPAHRANGLLVVAGIVAVVLGMLLLSAPVVRLMAAAARRTPFTTRLALRDLGRHQARSGAALAAITLAIGLPVAISVLAAASQHTADTGNLSDRQTMIRAGTRDPVIPLLSDAARRAQQSAVGRWAASVGGRRRRWRWRTTPPSRTPARAADSTASRWSRRAAGPVRTSGPASRSTSPPRPRCASSASARPSRRRPTPRSSPHCRVRRS